MPGITRVGAARSLRVNARPATAAQPRDRQAAAVATAGVSAAVPGRATCRTRFCRADDRRVVASIAPASTPASVVAIPTGDQQRGRGNGLIDGLAVVACGPGVDRRRDGTQPAPNSTRWARWSRRSLTATAEARRFATPTRPGEDPVCIQHAFAAGVGRRARRARHDMLAVPPQADALECSMFRCSRRCVGPALRA